MNKVLMAIGAATLVLAAAWAGEAEPKRWAVAVFPSGDEFSLEIADNPRTRMIGYMYREKLAPREGMLFVFAYDGRHAIWMKNCLAALDIIWLDPNLKVVDIRADAQPCPAQGECPGMYPVQEARYVLEVAAGTARSLGLQKGDIVEILPEAPPLARY